MRINNHASIWIDPTPDAKPGITNKDRPPDIGMNKSSRHSFPALPEPPKAGLFSRMIRV